MSDVNTEVKSELLNVQVTVVNKITIFSADDRVDKTKLEHLRKKTGQEIERFRQPEIWLQPVTVDLDEVFNCFMAINGVTPPMIDELSAQIDVLIGILAPAFDHPPANIATTASQNSKDANLNAEALACLGSIDTAKNVIKLMFLNKGIDIIMNAEYQRITKEQNKLLDAYRKQLRDKTVLAVENHVQGLQEFLQAFNAIQEVDPYLSKLSEYSSFLKGLITVV